MIHARVAVPVNMFTTGFWDIEPWLHNGIKQDYKSQDAKQTPALDGVLGTLESSVYLITSHITVCNALRRKTSFANLSFPQGADHRQPVEWKPAEDLVNSALLSVSKLHMYVRM